LSFFLESVFIGLWAFGWNRVSKKTHLLAIWLVALAASLSALWILLANGWMQKPVGCRIIGGRAQMTDFAALVFNSYGWAKFLHTVSSGFVVAAFFVMGVSAWHLLAKKHVELFRFSFRTAAIFGLVSCLIVTILGDLSAALVARYQPSKLAATESIWETTKGAPYHLLLIPDPAHERNAVEGLTIPNLLSFLAYQDPNSEVKGLKSIPPDERAPVWPTFLSFRLMVGLGFLFLLLALGAVFLGFKRQIEDCPRFLRLLIYFIPLPYLACELGWIVAELGRQPWIVYGMLKTSAGVSKTITAGQVWFSLCGFVLVYGVLILADLFLLFKFARQGPEEKNAARPALKGVMEA
jgi:cytochrome d ubiquinol oxidase subunit I